MGKSDTNHKRWRAVRMFFLSLRRNFAFKLFFIGFIILFIFSEAIYFIERDYIKYKVENGKTVEDTAASSNIRSMEEAVWWAFVTSTTVGYGDYYPKSLAGRVVGVLVMFFGMALVGVITGNIASGLVEKQLKEDRGVKQLNLRNHFIICGWKRDMTRFLHGIMERNKSYLASDIVLVNTADPQEIENLKMDPAFKYINYVHGDYIDENILHMANVREATKVLILADRLVQGSVQEVDSRTVMAVLTIKAMAKSVYTCAELLDSKFERYLRFSNCDEVILPSEYNRSFIAYASSGSGISHVISELLNVDADVSINTVDIQGSYIGKTYQDLYTHFIEKDHTILIGVLENTGNFFERKKEALEEAQKTPNISTLVDNLRFVKTLVANQPVINPSLDYVIKKYSRAIVIEGRHA